MPHVDLNTRRNTFCLYWDRSHRRIFRRHFRDSEKPLVINSENFDSYLKGTTVYLCSRQTFLDACKKFLDAPLLNDDTPLMKEIVRTEPILLHPLLRIHWVPRESAKAFLGRLFSRGPSFVEYHVLTHRGLFFWIVILGLFWLLAEIVLLATHFVYGATALGISLALIAASTVFFAKGPKEFLRLAPLHLAVVFAFGFGILYGLGYHLIHGFRNLA